MFVFYKSLLKRSRSLKGQGYRISRSYWGQMIKKSNFVYFKCFCDVCVTQMVNLRLKGILVYQSAKFLPQILFCRKWKKNKKTRELRAPTYLIMYTRNCIRHYRLSGLTKFIQHPAECLWKFSSIMSWNIEVRLRSFARHFINCVITVYQRSCGKVMFSVVSVRKLFCSWVDPMIH